VEAEQQTKTNVNYPITTGLKNEVQGIDRKSNGGEGGIRTPDSITPKTPMSYMHKIREKCIPVKEIS
jgi:hypothetical protein